MDVNGVVLWYCNFVEIVLTQDAMGILKKIKKYI